MTFIHSRRDFVRHAALLTAASAVGLKSATAADTFVVADTASGKIRGVEVDGIRVFKGIPYGADTAGPNRFMPPAPVAKWTGVRDALEYGQSAPQSEPGARRAASDLAVAGAGLRTEGEDCLVLNVWTPALADGRKRPVMVWCHGGGVATGSGSSPITEGQNLARRGDVVVVTINHRLNVLGFTYLGEPGGTEFAASGDAVGKGPVSSRHHRKRRDDQTRRTRSGDESRRRIDEDAWPGQDAGEGASVAAGRHDHVRVLRDDAEHECPSAD